MRGTRPSKARLHGSSYGTPLGRAVGDEDAAAGPMDRGSPYPPASQDMQAIEKDRARSSGRPPLVRVRHAAEYAGGSTDASVDPLHPAKPHEARRAISPKPSR